MAARGYCKISEKRLMSLRIKRAFSGRARRVRGNGPEVRATSVCIQFNRRAMRLVPSTRAWVWGGRKTKDRLCNIRSIIGAELTS
ncbi:hypothetical protein HETIRDRAFT_168891 [Heterobasidion irregulare TC 32-1]|uniref:Uncharacterized protein n=1 Tax=Heterobasidion irregulare (strain TC 32-1) TaxID=747525 RepID=W4K8P4_HETIT|nr:uncharacterized protein HETIRDRAFT_168891 [Heterobasidion irregulare TC 32-1]ETW82158.1 hypothetical protein HETIRDRAFT_168891 [Heterobasidion irregulare TC 32-1]